MALTYDGPDSVPPDEAGRVDTISFDGITVNVSRSGSPDTYFALEPPAADPILHTHNDTSNKELLQFVSENLSGLREAREDMLKRWQKSQSQQCRYNTGDVAYILGRPFMLRIRSAMQPGSMKHAARGRASTTSNVVHELSVAELYVFQMGNYDQRRGTFVRWAGSVVARNATALCRRALERAGVQDYALNEFRVVSLSGRPVRIDRVHSRGLLSEELIGFPASCLTYAIVREIAREIAPADEARQHEIIAAAVPEWEQARAILEDENSKYRRQ